MFALGAGAIYLIVAAVFDPLGRVQDAFTDSLFRESDGSRNVVLVAITEDELDTYGRLGTWPRSRHAEVVERLSEAGARVIVYDIIFADSGPDDQRLASAIASAGNVVLASAGSAEAGTDDDGVQRYAGFAVPASPLQAAARTVAHSHLATDDDGRVRRVPLVGEDAQTGERYASLTLAAVYLQFGRSTDEIDLGAAESFELFGRTVPLEDSRSLRVNYAGGLERFPSLTYAQVLAGDFDAARVKDKIVVVGVSAIGVDRHSAPLLGDAAGVEIHMNAIDTLLRARFLRVAPGWAGVLAGLGLAGLVGLAALRWRVRYVVPFALVLGVMYLGLSAFMSEFYFCAKDFSRARHTSCAIQ